MNINDLTIGQARELAELFTTGAAIHHQPFEIGKNYLIRTVTMIDTGRVVYDVWDKNPLTAEVISERVMR